MILKAFSRAFVNELTFKHFQADGPEIKSVLSAQRKWSSDLVSKSACITVFHFIANGNNNLFLCGGKHQFETDSCCSVCNWLSAHGKSTKRWENALSKSSLQTISTAPGAISRMANNNSRVVDYSGPTGPTFNKLIVNDSSLVLIFAKIWSIHCAWLYVDVASDASLMRTLNRAMKCSRTLFPHFPLSAWSFHWLRREGNIWRFQ